MTYFAIGGLAALIAILAAWVLLQMYRAGKWLIVWASGKLADVFFGGVPGGRP